MERPKFGEGQYLVKSFVASLALGVFEVGHGHKLLVANLLLVL
jgi:hypothetical protein